MKLKSTTGFFNILKFAHIHTELSLFLQPAHRGHTSTPVTVFLSTMLPWKAEATLHVQKKFLRGECNSAKGYASTCRQDYILLSRAGRDSHKYLQRGRR